MNAAAHPYAGHPRTFRAVAMPNGDARFGIAGPLVFLCEQRGERQDRPKYLSRAEAEDLRDALDAALSTFAVGAELAAGTGPRASTAPYPFRDHRTLADFEASSSAAVGPLRCPPREARPALTGDDRR